MAKLSAIDRAIESLEARKADQDRIIDMAIEALIAHRDPGAVTPTSTEPKTRKPRKKRGLPAETEGL